MRKIPVAQPAQCGAAGAVPRGRPRALSGQEIAEAQKLYWEECLPVRAIADALSVSHMTVWRAVCVPTPPAPCAGGGQLAEVGSGPGGELLGAPASRSRGAIQAQLAARQGN